MITRDLRAKLIVVLLVLLYVGSVNAEVVWDVVAKRGWDFWLGAAIGSTSLMFFALAFGVAHDRDKQRAEG